MSEMAMCPYNPYNGKEGFPIKLKANHFQISLPKGLVHHYEILIQPDKCPRSLNREVINTLINCYTNIFTNLRPVYDGKSNLYTRNFLPIGNNPMALQVELYSEGKVRKFIVHMQWMARISLDSLEEALKGKSLIIPHDAIQALDVILRHLPSMTYTPVGHSFFTQPTNSRLSLGQGREAWLGFHQSVVPAQWKMMLNINASSTAFTKAQSVLYFLCEILEVSNPRQFQRKGLTDSQHKKFANEINGLKVQTTHCSQKRKYRVTGLTYNSAQLQTFPLDSKGKTILYTVAKYFSLKYKIELEYAHLPCLQVGPEHKQNYLPLEICSIVPGQRSMKKLTESQTKEMIRATARSAPERENEINNLIRKADFNNDPYIKEFGIKISNSMIEIPGRVLKPPVIQFGAGEVRQEVRPVCGAWDMRGKQFYAGFQISSWAVVCFAPKETIKATQVQDFCIQLRKISSEVGMHILSEPCTVKYSIGSDQVEPLFRYLQSIYETLQLIIVILPSIKVPQIYTEVKRVGDTLLGLATQCIRDKNVVGWSPQTLSNICLKINAKLGGINSILHPTTRPLSIFEKPVIFIGAHLAHGSSSGYEDKLKRSPSLAALVGSMDAHPAKYTGTIRIQQHGTEIMQDMTNMLRETLQRFYKSTKGFKPHRIIIYRDSIPENHNQTVLINELKAIRLACTQLESDYQPGITYIGVQRRHHTRLFCADKTDRCGNSENVPPGTIVDIGITHPTEFDFYLCSHLGIQGTSRPSYYNILWDDNNFTPDQLQCVTYQLCHTYIRCTHSVSKPAPAYYARLVANRGRDHLKDSHDVGDDSWSNDETPEAMIEAITVHHNSKKVMYYV